MKRYFRKKLTGIGSIRDWIGVRDDFTLLDWRIAYGLPIFKERGTWVAFAVDLKKWRKSHPDVREESLRPPFPIAITHVTALRWGLVKTKTRFIDL